MALVALHRLVFGASGARHSGSAYYQGGYKTGPDGTSKVPMNRMVVNR